MRSIRYYGIHDVRVENIEKPSCGEKEVLIRVVYSGICGSDLHIYNQGMFIQSIPETMGHEFSGIVEETGEKVSGFQKGDKVTANPMVPCHACVSCDMGSYNTCENLGFIGEVRPGCFADYIVLPEDVVISVGNDADLRQMVLAEPLAVALHVCKRAALSSEDVIAVIGVGPVGLLIIEAAIKIFGVRNITAVDLSKQRQRMAADAGAAETCSVLNQGAYYNKVIEAAGTPGSFNTAIEHVRPNGDLYIVSIFEKGADVDINKIVSGQISLIGCNVYTEEDFRESVDMIRQRIVDVGQFISREYVPEECKDAFEQLSSSAKDDAKVVFTMK